MPIYPHDIEILGYRLEIKAIISPNHRKIDENCNVAELDNLVEDGSAEVVLEGGIDEVILEVGKDEVDVAIKHGVKVDEFIREKKYDFGKISI